MFPPSPTPTPRRVLGALSTNTLLPTPPSFKSLLTPLKPLTPVSLKRKTRESFSIYSDADHDQENDANPTPCEGAKRRRTDRETSGERKAVMPASSPCVARVQRVKVERDDSGIQLSQQTIPSESEHEDDFEPESQDAPQLPTTSSRPSVARSVDDEGTQTLEVVDDADATESESEEDPLEPVKRDLPPSSPLRRTGRARTPVLLPSSSPPRAVRVRASPELASTLKLRLKMAMFKVLTNQTRTPLAHLSEPNPEQVYQFRSRNTARKMECGFTSGQRTTKTEEAGLVPVMPRFERALSGMEGLAAAAARREAI